MNGDVRQNDVLREALRQIRDRGCAYRRPMGECFFSQRPEASWCSACIAKKALIKAAEETK